MSLDEQLRDAAEAGKLDVVQRLCRRGANPKAINNDGNTPLHEACLVGHLDVAKYLVEQQGANPKATNNFGSTPLHYACYYGHLDVAKYLVEQQGANPKATNNDGGTPLHEACWNGDLDIAKYLVEQQGANPKATNNFGSTPLHYACYYGHLDVAKYLVEQQGANPKATNNDGGTPLHEACWNGDLDIAKYLVEQQGANPKATNNNGWTPSDHARNNCHTHVVQYLENWRPKETIPKQKQPQRAPTHAVISQSKFLQEMWEPCDGHIVLKCEKLVPLIDNVHEMKLFYTYLCLANKLGFIEDDYVKNYVYKGLDKTSKTIKGREAWSLFVIILEYAESTGTLDRKTRLELQRDANHTDIANSEFIKDIRQEMARYARQIWLLEQRVGGLEDRVDNLQDRTRVIQYQVHTLAKSLRDTQKAVQRKDRVRATTGFMCGILNAVSMGVVGSVVQGVVGAAYDYVVDFTNLGHLGSVLEQHGDTLDVQAFKAGSYLAADLIDSVASEEASEIVSEAVSEQVTHEIWARFEQKALQSHDGTTTCSIQSMVIMSQFVQHVSQTNSGQTTSGHSSVAAPSIPSTAASASASVAGTPTTANPGGTVPERLGRLAEMLGVDVGTVGILEGLKALEIAVHGTSQEGSIMKRLTELESHFK